MKLISCYVENFGAIKQKRFDFKDLNSICEPNGYGKTTLAAFLEDMFYGMNSDRSNGKDFCDRRHFSPFGGGRFGGNVTFSIGKDVYKAERYFDEKSETRDSLTVYRNGDLYDGLGANIGEKIFGIDRQSFERTIFVNAAEIEISSTGSIDAKLNNFVEGGTDDTNTEAALKRLEKKAKEYKKTKSGADLITTESAKLLEITGKINDAASVKEGLPEKYARLSAFDEEYKKLQERLGAAQKNELILKDWERYDGLVADAEKEAEKVKALEKEYAEGLPLAEEITEVKKACAQKDALLPQAEKKMSEEDAAALSALEMLFKSGIPSEDELREQDLKVNKALETEAEIRSLSGKTYSAREETLRRKFLNREPDKDYTNSLDAAVKEYERAEKEYGETPDYVLCADSGQKGGQRAGRYIFAAVAACVLAAVGVGVVFVQLIAGIIMIAAGVTFLIATGFAYLNKKASYAATEKVRQINPEKAEKEKAKYAAAAKVAGLLSVYGYSDEKGIIFAAESLKKDAESYAALKKDDEETSSALAIKRQQLRRLKDELNGYFARYSISDDNLQLMTSKLRSKIAEYNLLLKTKSSLAEQIESVKRTISQYDETVRAFCEKYAFDPDAIRDILPKAEKDRASHANSVRLFGEKSAEAERFRANKNLDVRPEISDGESDGVREIAEQNRSARAALSIEISDDESQAEKLDELLSEKTACEEKLGKYKKDYFLVEKATELIKEADRKLKDKYVAPVRNNFLRYASVLEKTLGEKIVMTANFEIRYERNGKERSEKHLSAGQRSLCAFCFRMALIDNMYPEEKPFLILDDPFVNLDGEHIKKVKAILKELSENLQIIYFTCHESRAL